MENRASSNAAEDISNEYRHGEGESRMVEGISYNITRSCNRGVNEEYQTNPGMLSSRKGLWHTSILYYYNALRHQII